jgi:hypothetical protein
MDFPSKANAKNILVKHLLNRIHAKSAENQGIMKERDRMSRSMDNFTRPVLSDIDAISGHVRLSYTLFRQEVPFQNIYTFTELLFPGPRTNI